MPQWWSEQKAAFWLCVIDFCILFTLYGYIGLLVNGHLLDQKTENYGVWICMGFLGLLNWFLFLKNNKYKKIIAKYDKESKKGEIIKKYKIIVLVLIIIILLLVLMLYLTGKKFGN